MTRRRPTGRHRHTRDLRQAEREEVSALERTVEAERREPDSLTPMREYQRWSLSQCSCPHNRECNTIGVRACSKCEPGLGYVYRHSSGTHPMAKLPGPVVERQGIDVNDYTLKHILPGAAQMCEEGQLREKMAERDLPKFERKVYYATEVHGLTMTVNGVTRPLKGVYKTVTPLPYGIKPVMGRNVAELHWCYRMALMRQRVTRDAEVARRLSSGAAITFVVVTGGIDVVPGEVLGV